MIGFLDAIATSESLCEELLPYVSRGPLGPMVHHPLIIDMNYREGCAAWINQSFRFKEKLAGERLRDRDWFGYIFLHERPYRLDAFQWIANELSPSRYWKALGKVWDDSENSFQHSAVWQRLWLSGRAIEFRPLVMNRHERARLKSLPMRFDIWRGSARSRQGLNGMSWTLDQKRAEWFGRRWRKPNTSGWLAHGTIKRDDCLAYFNGRNEEEIVVKPSRVRSIERTELRCPPLVHGCRPMV